MTGASGRMVCSGAATRWLARILPLVVFLPLFAQKPERALSLTQQGARYLEQNQLARALDAFQQAARLQPLDPAIQLNIGLTFYRMGRYRQALEPLGKAISQHPSGRQARFLRGAIFFHLNKLEACLREIGELRSDPEQGEQVLFMVIESYRKLGKVDEAQAAFRELNERFPDSAFLHRLMGIAYEAQFQADKAIEEFQAALRVRAGMPEVAFAIGYIYWKQRDYGNARIWLEKELAGQPCYARAHHCLAEIARADEKWDDAVTLYRKALRCDPGLQDPYLGLGMVYERQREWSKAIEVYREVTRRMPNDSQGHFKLGIALQRAGKTEEPRVELAKANDLLAAEQAKARESMQTMNPPPRP